MDTLTFLMFMMLVVLVVIVIQLRRASREGGTCKCPVDQKWLDEFNKWAAAEYVWAGQVQKWIDEADPCLKEKCAEFPDFVLIEPPSPPPCRFGSC